MRQSKRVREVGVCVRRHRNLSETGQSSLGTESTGELEIILRTSILSLFIQVYYQPTFPMSIFLNNFQLR